MKFEGKLTFENLDGIFSNYSKKFWRISNHNLKEFLAGDIYACKRDPTDP